MNVTFDSDNFIAKFQNEQNIEAALEQVQTIDVGFTETDPFVCTVDQGEDFVCDMGGEVPSGDYDGPYTVTPSQQQQALHTMNKTLSQNVVIKPIPSNYGLITWNGSTLTVS